MMTPDNSHVSTQQTGEATDTRAEAGKNTNRKYRRIMEWLVVLFLIYVGWCVLLYVSQDSMMFPRAYAMGLGDHENVYDDAIRLVRKIETGNVEAFLLLAPNASPDQPAPLVVFCHGNAETIDFLHSDVERYHALGCSVLLPEYRGYGRSAGEPSQEGIVDDVHWFTQQALENPAVDGDRIVYHGRSLGGGVATDLATRRQPDAIILQSTFSSMASMAKRYYVPTFLVKHPFRNDHALAEMKNVKLLIAHGTRDAVIPFKHHQILTEVRPDADTITFNCEHNDFPGLGNQDPYWDAIETTLAKADIIDIAEPHTPPHGHASAGSPAPASN